MNRFSHLCLIALWVILAACSPAGASATPTFLPATIIVPTSSAVPVLSTQPGPTQTPTPAPTNLPTPTTPPPARLAAYTLKANLNYNRHALTVEERIDYPNRTGQELRELLLVVEPNRHPGTFRLNGLKAGESSISTYTLENNQLKFSLPSALAPGQSLQIEVRYELNLPVIPAPSNDVRAAIFGYSARQVNLVDWYPYVPPYQPEKGWLVHNPWYYGEHQVYEMADFQVEVNLVDPPANLILAAAAQAKIEGSRYTYTHLKARNFTFSASNMYVVYAAVSGQTTITSYAFTFDTTGGRTALNDAVRALELYSRLFGPYPHSTLAVVEADFHDGMEYDGLYFLSKGFYSTYDGTPKGYLTMIGVHEMAHQWWYARVANDQALEPWLDESLATYSELLYYTELAPDLPAWWWGYRIDYFKPAGWVNQRIYDYTGSYPYRDGVYLRGARFLDQIRQRSGDAAFFAFLKDYATRYQDQIVTTNDFFELFKQYSGADLSDLKKAYFK